MANFCQLQAKFRANNLPETDTFPLGFSLEATKWATGGEKESFCAHFAARMLVETVSVAHCPLLRHCGKSQFAPLLRAPIRPNWSSLVSAPISSSISCSICLAKTRLGKMFPHKTCLHKTSSTTLIELIEWLSKCMYLHLSRAAP